MLGGEEEKDPDAQKKEEERLEALRQQEEERKAKHARMEAEREKVRQQIRDKVRTTLLPIWSVGTQGQWVPKPQLQAPLNPSSDLRPSSESPFSGCHRNTSLEDQQGSPETST